MNLKVAVAGVVAEAVLPCVVQLAEAAAVAANVCQVRGASTGCACAPIKSAHDSG